MSAVGRGGERLSLGRLTVVHEPRKAAFVCEDQSAAAVLSGLFVPQRLAKAKVFRLWWCYGPSAST